MRHGTFITLIGVISLVLIAGTEDTHSDHPEIHGGAIPATPCITPEQYDEIEAAISEAPVRATLTKSIVLFEDPMGGGGTNSFGKPVNNYVDLDGTAGILDYMCRDASYNGHLGHDIEIADFYDMDEGVPFLVSAPGVVVAVHDGEFDRNLAAVAVPANYVIVEHADGSTSYCWHMKKNSVRVLVGQSVAAGDTLGMIGSSGSSTWPHIHFEVSHAGVVEPHSGPCQTSASRWVTQLPHVLDLPFELFQHGVTTLPMTVDLMAERPPSAGQVTAGSTIYSWIHCRSLQNGDVLAWEIWGNGSLWTTWSFSPGGPYRISWWYTNWNLPTSSSWYGDWNIKIKHNGVVVGEQDFVLNASANQYPVAIDSSMTLVKTETVNSISGEFRAEDPDGSAFWYVVDPPPSNGTLVQDGGRKRKFTYTPDAGFVGDEIFTFYAIDDDSAAGPTGQYVITVEQGCVDPDGDGYGTPLAGSPCPDDNCPTIYNPGQEDGNGNGIGDICECTDPNYTWTGGGDGHRLGWRVAGAGDMNNDGYDDIIVGREGLQVGNAQPGEAYVYSGRTGELMYTFTGETNGDWFGCAVSGVGDLNDDGYDDVIVGAMANDAVIFNSGRAYVFHGGSGPFPVSVAAADADMIFSGSGMADYFGISVARVDDIDGDAVSEILIGAEQYSGANGYAHLYSGQTGTLMQTFSGEAAGDLFGHDIADAGDVNNDGTPDFIIGAYQNNAGGDGAGRAYVYSGATYGILHTFTGAHGDRLGEAVSGAGDVNDDGYDDVLVGAPGYDDTFLDEGIAYVFSGETGDVIRSHDGSATEEQMGTGVAGLGEIDPDGIPDYAVSAPGTSSLFLYSGELGDQLAEFTSGVSADWFGNDVASAGDCNGDGIDDLVVGAYLSDAGGNNTGRAYLYCLGDVDGDIFSAGCDNCPRIYNTSQTDSDGDGVGDACDACPGFDDMANSDTDTIPDDCDNCPSVANPDQTESDGDGNGDACDLCPGFDDFVNSDADTIPDGCDNCPDDDNPLQADADGDGVGDACELCPGHDDLVNSDTDTIPDGCDNCPNDDNPLQTDTDGDEIGDVCDIGYTPVGTSVLVNLEGDMYVLFGEVTTAGFTMPTGSPTGPEGPSGYTMVPAGGEMYREFPTTAVYGPPVQFQLTYDPADITGDESSLRVFQESPGKDGSTAWTDVTFSQDLGAHWIVGEVSTLTRFVLAAPIPCACNCHGDPQCDAESNVLDVVHAVNIAFRSYTDIPDPLPSCPWTTTDVDCSGYTDVIDVVKFVNVAFRSGDPAVEFCDPCE